MKNIFIILFVFSITLGFGQQKMREPRTNKSSSPLTIEMYQQGTSEEIAKKRFVILDFWATWCGPCVKEFPHINKLNEQYKNQVAIISITYEPLTKIEPFLQKHPLQTIIGLDTDFSMFMTYEAWSIPMVVIIDQQQKKIIGELHPANLDEKIIDNLLNNVPQEFPDQRMPYFEPEGAKRFFLKSSGLREK